MRRFDTLISKSGLFSLSTPVVEEGLRSSLLPTYPGLPAHAVAGVHEAVRNNAHADTLFSMQKSLRQAILPVYQAAGVEDEWAGPLAAACATMEANALSSQRQLDHYAEEEQRRNRRWHYRFRFDEDAGIPTKMAYWIADRFPPWGVPLSEVEAIFDEAVALAKKGAFTPRGELKDLPGAPMVLPEWFKRRGYQTHWIDPRWPLFDVEEHGDLVRLV